MKARAVLREATADAHERVDRLFSALDLADESSYRLFLLAQAAAHLPVEAAIDAAGAAGLLQDWPERRRAPLLLADLAALGAEAPESEAAPPLRSSAEIFGAIYVLEGSRLGGALLKRSLAPGAPDRFLSAPQPPAAWRNFLARLEECLYNPPAVEAAGRTANQIFVRFEKAGRRYLEFARA